MNVRYALGHLAVGSLLVVAVAGFTHKTNPTTAFTERLPIKPPPVKLLPDVIDGVGAWAFGLKLQTAEISSNSAYTTLVDRVSKRLIEAAGRTKYAETAKQFKWDFKVLKNDSAQDAFGLPGGKIGVYTGLFQVTENDEAKLAVVLGHEVIHALARHAAERMSERLQQSLALAVTGHQLARQGLSPEATAGVMVALGLSYEGAVMLPFSRAHESEADHEGLLLMAQAGYDPRKAIAFWQEMMQRRGAQAPAFLSTHPSDQERIKQLQGRLSEALQYYAPHAHGAAVR